MIKTAETIQPGDIFRTEYGDYDCWCNFTFVSCEPYDNRTTKITVRSIWHEEPFDVFECTPIDKIEFEVIGNENTNNNK